MSAFLANLAVAAGILVFGLAVLLMVIGIVSYVRIRHARFLWISLAFGLFAAQGALLTIRMVDERGDLPASLPAYTFLNLAIVLALYVAVMRQ